MRGRAGPPRWVAALLEGLLPAGVRGASIRADLEEEYLERRPGLGRDVWFTWEAARLAARYLTTGGGRGMGRWIAHVRHAVRRIRRDPGYALISMGTMALGIGATAAIFSVVDAVLLEPLPFRNPGRLVAVFETFEARGRDRNVANPGNVRAWSDAAALEELGAMVIAQPNVVSESGEPREVMVSMVTPDLFEVLGADLALGPGFSPGAGGEDGEQVVLSYRAWQELFGGDPDVVGRTMTVNGTSGEVRGVLPAIYVPFAEETELFAARPLDAMGDQTSTGRFLWTVARLAPGVEVARAQEELDAVAAGLRQTFPDYNAGWGVAVVSLQEHVVGDVRSGLWMLLGAVGMLLLIAVANVANLGLARATDRRREMAVRTSLGASGGSLAGQLLVESLVLALLGGAAGVAAAHLGTRAIAARMPEAFAMPRVAEAGVDGGVLLLALGVVVVTGVLVGLAPALWARRTAPAATLNAEGRGPGRESGRLRDLLVVAEVALSAVLLVGAGLLGRSLATLVTVDPGLDAENVITARINLSGDAYRGQEPDRLFFGELARRMEDLPGVEAAGGVTFLPMGGLGSATSFYPADRPPPPRDEWPVADIRNVMGDYFGAMGIELLRGRTFGDGDVAGSPPVVVVNETLARTHWPGEDPLGKPLAVNWSELEPWTVVGVVEDVRLGGLEQEPREAVYHAYDQAPWFPFVTVALRARGDAATAVEGLRETLRAMDPGLPLSRVQVMGDVVRSSVARPRMTTFLMLLFAGVAAVLAAVGLYGVLSYAVARRSREFGVRMAMGAERSHVLGMVLRKGLALAGVGLALGMAGALAGARALESLLYGVAPHDPASIASAAGLLAVVAMAASVVPALRATRVAPVEALKSE